MNVFLNVGENHLSATLQVKLSLVDQIKSAQMEDSYLKRMREKVEAGFNTQFVIKEDGILVIGNRLCIPDVEELRKQIMNEAHTSSYVMHPGSTKMYQNLKLFYWWPTMKKDVAEFVVKCLTCQQVKAEHQAPAGKLQSLKIPEGKWEKITMDFVVGLPRTF